MRMKMKKYSKLINIITYSIVIAIALSFLHTYSVSQVLPPLGWCNGVQEPTYAPDCGPRLSENCKSKSCSGEIMERVHASCCKQKTPAPPQGICIQVWGKWCL